MSAPQFQFGRGAAKAAEVARPTCNPCREPDHGRCATVLARNDIIDSTFECACFHRDPDRHEANFQARQEAYAEGMAEHFGRSDWDAEGRRSYSRWRGSMWDAEYYTGETYGDR